MTPAYLLPPLAGQYAAFLRAIAAAPDCDAPRLVLADWLEEHAGTVRVTCGRCEGRRYLGASAPGQHGWIGAPPCPDCEGEGSRWVSNGCGERAEFIRVQCELAAHGRLAFDPNWKAARGLREAELRLWHGVSGHFPVVGYNPVYNGLAPEYSTSAGTFTVRRGFIGTVRGPLAALLGGSCEAVGPHHRDRCDGGRIRCPNAQFTQDCPDCHGTGRTPGDLERMGAELLAVRRADASDREPWVNFDRTHWGWWERTIHTGPDTLPPAVMDAMDDDPRRHDYGIGVARRKGRPTPGGCVLFGTETAARDALSHAVLALARRRAGLEREPIDPVPAS